jgi:thioredoxin-related protein
LSAGGCLSRRLRVGTFAVRSEIGDWLRVKAFRLALLLLSFSFFTLGSARAEAEWLQDLPKARAQAKENHKLLLLDFTGSDWCIWCKKLDAEVFSQPAFQSYAKDHLVLMKVDFPRKISQSPETKKQNEELAQKFGVQGFPTIVVLNDEGKQVGELGYQPGGADAFVKELKKLPKS